MKKYLFTLFLVVAGSSICKAGALVVLEPYSGGCQVDKISPPNQSTTTWTSSLANQKAVLFQSASDTDVYIGFIQTISSSTASVALYNKGDSLSITTHANRTFYFWGDGAGADIRALYCE